MDETLVAGVAEGAGGGAAAGTDESAIAAGGAEVVETPETLDFDIEVDTKTDDGKGEGQEKPAGDEKSEEKDDPALEEYKGMVSNRLRSLIKQAPELGQVFKKYPQLQAHVEKVFRQQSAMQDLFPTLAEAREMRTHFPNGIKDVQDLYSQVQELDDLDTSFVRRNDEGVYTDHPKLIQNWFEMDKPAAVALMRQLPKEWAKLDEESYNDVMGKIVGATVTQTGIYDYLVTLSQDQRMTAEDIQEGIKKVVGKLNGFVHERKPSEDELRLKKDREGIEKERAKDRTERAKAFGTTFTSKSHELQKGIIQNHPMIQKLQQVKSVTPQKKAEIASKIREEIISVLKGSRQFLKSMNEAYNAQNLDTLLNLQKAAWSQRWLLNSAVRRVLRAEVPHLISKSQARGAAASGTRPPVKPAASGEPRSKAPTGPYQENGRWYKKDGQPFSAVEILAGKHLQS